MRLLWVTFSSNRDYGVHLANGPFDNCYPPDSPPYNQPQLGDKVGNFDNCAQPQIWMAAVVVDNERWEAPRMLRREIGRFPPAVGRALGRFVPA